MKAKFEKGIWVVKPPQGYDIVRTSGERKIVVNADGRKLKSLGMENTRHEERRNYFEASGIGCKMYKQQLHKIFINPFYCGLISHGMLNGKVVDGVHEKMISKEKFMKVNEVILLPQIWSTA
ncbi:MAG: recombinase family protein [Sphingobacteriaceae bacterium]|nr:recombinase family protein [Sphingobacteriaceae bacterium]